MKVQALKRLVGDYGLLQPGDVVDLSPTYASKLISLGYAKEFMEAVDDGHKDKKAPGSKLHRRGRGKS